MKDNIIKDFLELISLHGLFRIFLVIGLGWLLLKLANLFLHRLSERFQRHRFQISWIYPILRLVVWLAVANVIVFAILKPTESIILAVTTSAGITFGLAAQDVIRNILAGIVMLFNRPFQIGDMVQIGSHYGEIISMDLNMVRMKTFDDNTVAIPNSEIVKQAVSNANSGELTEMVVVDFDVPATADVALLKRLAREAAVCSPYAYLIKPVVVAIEDRFEMTHLTRLKIKAYVLDIRLERAMASDIVERLKKAFQQRGITYN